MPRVTSADVARASGVSRTTVSYVLNGTPGTTISQATRERVLRTAERLGYAPSAAARTLRRGRSDLVLCALPDWPTGPATDLVVDHLAAALAERGLALLVHHRHGAQPLAELWRVVTPRAVVGVTPFEPDDTAAMRRAGVQVVTLPADDAGAAAFATAQEGIGRLQAEHLRATGHDVLAWAGPDDPRLADFAAPRLAGVRAACGAHGLPAPLETTVGGAVPVPRDVVDAWRTAGVTGVAAYNDDVALAVLAGLRAAGVGVPGEVGVVGVDDTAAGRLSDPPLSTVWQPTEPQAAYLAAAVVAALDGVAPPAPPPDPTRVVARGTT